MQVLRKKHFLLKKCMHLTSWHASPIETYNLSCLTAVMESSRGEKVEGRQHYKVIFGLQGSRLRDSVYQK